MRRTNLPGHALRSEGAAYVHGGSGSGWIRAYEYGRAFIGVALCECGTTSPALASNGARKRWHAAHKDGIRALTAAALTGEGASDGA